MLEIFKGSRYFVNSFRNKVLLKLVDVVNGFKDLFYGEFEKLFIGIIFSKLILKIRYLGEMDLVDLILYDREKLLV